MEGNHFPICGQGMEGGMSIAERKEHSA